MLAFHFNVLTAGSIRIASEAEFVEICKQQYPMCFSRDDPVYWGRLSRWKVTPKISYVPNFFKRKNEAEMPILGDKRHLNIEDILRDKSIVGAKIFLEQTYHFVLYSFYQIL